MRARRLLKAFFPDVHMAVGELTKAEDSFHEACEGINESVRERLVAFSDVLEPEEVYRILNFDLVSDKNDRLPGLTRSKWIGKAVRYFMPSQHLAIKNSLSESEWANLKNGEDWEGAWQRVRKKNHEIVADLEMLIPFLKELNSWRASPHVEPMADKQELVRKMNSWLEACVKCDLLAKETSIVGVLRSQNQTKRKKTFEFLMGFWHDQKLTKKQYEAQSKALSVAEAECEQLRSELQHLQIDQGQPETSEGTSKRPELTDEVAALLDQHGPLDGENEGLSVRLQNMFKAKQPKRFTFTLNESILNVGRPDGLAPLVSRLEEQLTGLNKLEHETSSQGSCVSIIHSLESLKTTADAYHIASNETIKEFQAQFLTGSKLALALNELTALFTPARWAYDDVSFSDSKGEETELQQGGVSVSLTLNTAELNTLALVLFFLCAPSGQNPLRMLILDDPLQNMDELTVTTVARGIRRLMQLWKEPVSDSENGMLADWQVVILLHGEESLERMRREIPAHTYYLPWQSPSSGSEEERTFDSEPPRFSGELVGLTDFFQTE